MRECEGLRGAGLLSFDAGDRLYKRAQAQSDKKKRASEDAAKRREEEEEAEVRECTPHDIVAAALHR